MVVNMDMSGTQAEFGAVVGISQQAVSDLVAREVLKPGASVGVWVVAYCSHLREMAAGRAASGDLDLAGERARLAKEQADRIAMQNQVTRKELAPTYLLEEILVRAGTRAGAILETIPGMIKRRVPSLSSSEIAAIACEVAKARNIAASMTLADLQDTADQKALDDAEDMPAEHVEGLED
jgi:phage terminase Nu1 subunit (DNA packaging protein)